MITSCYVCFYIYSWYDSLDVCIRLCYEIILVLFCVNWTVLLLYESETLRNFLYVLVR